MVDSKQTKEHKTVLFRCLSHSRRRYVLYCLKEVQGPLALADLAEDVADFESEKPRTEISAETVKDVYMSLYHKHVPKLEDVDLVRYDQERDSVELREYPEELLDGLQF